MKIAGIIAEYNPFHTGHAYHIQKTRELTGADYIIVVLSGDFVQRGAPALYSKHLRTRMALLGGADLVFELPSTHACESAEFFAQNAVGLLDGLGCVDVLSFGSESGTIEPFLKLGSFLSAETPEYRNLIKKYLKKHLTILICEIRMHTDDKLSSLVFIFNLYLIRKGVGLCLIKQSQIS